MKDKLEALIKEAAALAKECDPEAAIVLYCLHGSMLCGQTGLMAALSGELAQVMHDKILESLAERGAVQ